MLLPSKQSLGWSELFANSAVPQIKEITARKECHHGPDHCQHICPYMMKTICFPLLCLGIKTPPEIPGRANHHSSWSKWNQTTSLYNPARHRVNTVSDCLFLPVCTEGCSHMAEPGSQRRDAFLAGFSRGPSHDALSQNSHCSGADKDAHNCLVESETYYSRSAMFTWRRMATPHKVPEEQINLFWLCSAPPERADPFFPGAYSVPAVPCACLLCSNGQQICLKGNNRQE